jgi:hypothetical protein
VPEMDMTKCNSVTIFYATRVGHVHRGTCCTVLTCIVGDYDFGTAASDPRGGHYAVRIVAKPIMSPMGKVQRLPNDTAMLQTEELPNTNVSPARIRFGVPEASRFHGLSAQ